MNEYSKFVIMNCVSVVAGSIAIGIACKATKSGVPLFALSLIPRWNITTGGGNKNE